MPKQSRYLISLILVPIICLPVLANKALSRHIPPSNPIGKSDDGKPQRQENDKRQGDTEAMLRAYTILHNMLAARDKSNAYEIHANVYSQAYRKMLKVDATLQCPNKFHTSIGSLKRTLWDINSDGVTETYYNCVTHQSIQTQSHSNYDVIENMDEDVWQEKAIASRVGTPLRSHAIASRVGTPLRSHAIASRVGTPLRSHAIAFTKQQGSAKMRPYLPERDMSIDRNLDRLCRDHVPLEAIEAISFLLRRTSPGELSALKMLIKSHRDISIVNKNGVTIIDMRLKSKRHSFTYTDTVHYEIDNNTGLPKAYRLSITRRKLKQQISNKFVNTDIEYHKISQAM